MKSVFTIYFLSISSLLLAQLPDGSIAPDFNFYDINGQQHHLYSYLSQGKTVILNFSEAWCQVCWNHHQTGVMQDFYNLYGPDGSNEATVLFIEKDSIMGREDIEGGTTATAGNWTLNTPYPIIDTSTANEAYQPDERPTIYGIYPDKTIFNLGRIDADELYAFVQAYSGEVLPFDTLIKVTVEEANDPRCFESDDGSIDLDVDGPGTSYTYIWNSGQVSQDIAGLDEGTYRCTITDNLNNRHILDPINLSEPEALMLTFLKTTPTSETALNGSVAVSVTGGTVPYDYLWNNGGDDFIIENVGEGSYSVQVIDDNGCQLSDSTTLEIPDCSLVISINVEPTACDENPTGEINIIVAGATPPIRYRWSNGDTTRNISGLASGGYELTVSDAMGCSATVGEIVEIEDRDPPRPIIRDAITLYLNEAGVAEISAEAVDSGSFDNCGILDIQIEQSVFDCSNIGRNFREFTVIDQNLNIASRDYEVIVLDTLEPYFICHNDTTVKACDGTVNYLRPQVVDNCPQGAVLTQAALGPGAKFPLGTTTETYTYITNGGEFRTVCSFDITIEEIIDADINVRDVSCPGDDDGSATVEIDQTDKQFSFAWNNDQNTQTAVNLLPGSYMVTVSDGADCRFVKTVFVGEPVDLGIRVDSITPNADKANVFITPLGGTPPFNFAWSEGGTVVSTAQNPRALTLGSYQLQITDDNACTFQTTVIVDDPTPLFESSLLRDFQISPNPTQGPFDLTFPAQLFGDFDLSISNLTGKKVYAVEMPVQPIVRIQPGRLPKGIYLLNVILRGEQVTKRLIIH
ncbi:MAG: T9SS type A sorting domain-containing protein [Saprospiraceae bacterium]|nr:T9SS type A sorting domain-containing protein [Saprospiraceae bacterium]